METIELKNLYPHGIRTGFQDEQRAKEIYRRAFPSDERRDFCLIRPLTQSETMTFYLICTKSRGVIGILSLWDFENFVYIEHFALCEELRGGGYGTAVLQLLQSVTQKPVVLEVELPNDELSRRRIEFYSRLGFRTLPFDYIQPPYDSTKSSLPMLIMLHGEVEEDKKFFSYAVRTLHGRVYGKNS